MTKPFTKIHRFGTTTMTDYELKIKLNSYKDGILVIDIVDSEGIEINELEMINVNYNNINNVIIKTIKKLLNNNNIKTVDTLELMNRVILRLAIWTANLKGESTQDFDIYDCQTMIVIKYIKG